MNYKKYDKMLVEIFGSMKIIAPFTFLMQSGDDIIITYYGTIILRFLKNGKIILNSGEWQTAGTKKRLNKFQDVVKIQKIKKIWWVYGKGPKKKFYNGIVVYNDKYDELVQRMIDV